METFTRTVPIPAVSAFTVSTLFFDWPGQVIAVTLAAAGGQVMTHSWTGATATTLMTQLNKANLSVTSLHRRVIDRLIADNVIAGSASGSPD